jgi:hypothetical protein
MTLCTRYAGAGVFLGTRSSPTSPSPDLQCIGGHSAGVWTFDFSALKDNLLPLLYSGWFSSISFKSYPQLSWPVRSFSIEYAKQYHTVVHSIECPLLCRFCAESPPPAFITLYTMSSLAIRVASSAARRAGSLLRAIQAHPPSCPCHSNPSHHHQGISPLRSSKRSFATPLDHSQQKEYAFEMVRGYRKTVWGEC